MNLEMLGCAMKIRRDISEDVNERDVVVGFADDVPVTDQELDAFEAFLLPQIKQLLEADERGRRPEDPVARLLKTALCDSTKPHLLAPFFQSFKLQPSNLMFA